jgi:hypothetical protein
VDGQAILTVGGAVVLLTQLVKWVGLPDGKGPIAVMVFSIFGTALWGWSHGGISQANAFDYFAGWANVALSAAGVFGFTRAASIAVTGTKTPPTGAGASPTAKDGRG